MNRFIAILSSFAIVGTVVACSSAPQTLKTDKDPTEAADRNDDDDETPLPTKQTQTPPPAGNVIESDAGASESCNAPKNQQDTKTCAKCCLTNTPAVRACACGVAGKCSEACGGGTALDTSCGKMDSPMCMLCMMTSCGEELQSAGSEQVMQCLTGCLTGSGNGNGSGFPFPLPGF